jgi:hypothetical protein
MLGANNPIASSSPVSMCAWCASSTVVNEMQVPFDKSVTSTGNNDNNNNNNTNNNNNNINYPSINNMSNFSTNYNNEPSSSPDMIDIASNDLNPPILFKVIPNPAHENPVDYAKAFGLTDECAAEISKLYDHFEGHYNAENSTMIYLEGKIQANPSISLSELGFTNEAVDRYELLIEEEGSLLEMLHFITKLIPCFLVVGNIADLPPNEWCPLSYDNGTKVWAYRATDRSTALFPRKVT